MQGSNEIRSYKDLRVWQQSMDLVETTYALTSHYPKSEQLGLSSQMRRASVSIPSNIAEGYGRQATGEYRHHLCIARGSLLELETQLILSQRVGLVNRLDGQAMLEAINQLVKMLSSLIAKLH